MLMRYRDGDEDGDEGEEEETSGDRFTPRQRNAKKEKKGDEVCLKTEGMSYVWRCVGAILFGLIKSSLKLDSF